MKLTQLVQGEGLERAEVVAVSVDTREQSRGVISQLQSQGLDPSKLVFLEDTGHRVIDRYGLLNTSYGVAIPAVFLVDRTGVVRWRFVERNYRVRATNEAIVEALDQLP